VQKEYCDTTPESPRRQMLRQRLGKHVFAATDTRATTDNILGMMFSIRCVQSGFEEEFG
jgi:hypothetical protein